MSALQQELEAAVKASSPVVSMLALCRAWALVPSTRIAKVARGFGRQLSVESVPGANQAEREVAWLELAARAGPVDVQELLALLLFASNVFCCVLCIYTCTYTYTYTHIQISTHTHIKAQAYNIHAPVT